VTKNVRGVPAVDVEGEDDLGARTAPSVGSLLREEEGSSVVRSPALASIGGPPSGSGDERPWQRPWRCSLVRLKER
jgi:hypothetical protein